MALRSARKRGSKRQEVIKGSGAQNTRPQSALACEDQELSALDSPPTTQSGLPDFESLTSRLDQFNTNLQEAISQFRALNHRDAPSDLIPGNRAEETLDNTVYLPFPRHPAVWLIDTLGKSLAIVRCLWMLDQNAEMRAVLCYFETAMDILAQSLSVDNETLAKAYELNVMVSEWLKREAEQAKGMT